MNPLNVLHVDSAGEYRGGQNKARLLMKELRALGGVRHGLAARSGSRLVREAESLGVQMHPAPWRAPIDPRPPLRIRGEIRRGWDLIHVHDSRGLQSTLAVRWLSGRRIPIIVSRRISVPMRSPSTWSRADAIVAVSRAVEAGPQAQGIAAEKTRLIHDGVSLEELERRLSERLRQRAVVGPEVTLVGTVGALTPEAGQAWFLESVAAIVREHPAAHYVLFGDGPERIRLERLAAALGTADQVSFPGAVEAVLLSAAGGLVELAGKLIPTIPPGYVTVMAKKMDRLLSDSAARSLRLGNAGSAAANARVRILPDPRVHCTVTWRAARPLTNERLRREARQQMRQLFNIRIPGRRSSGPRVFLLRAHKTAGQSFNLSLSRAFRDSEICPGHFTWQLVDVDAEAAQRYRYFQGHIGRPTADRIAPEARLVTMLRDPVARLTSSYFYWRSQSRRVKNWNAHRIADRLQSMTLLEYVASDDPVIRRSSWNVQARLLAGADYGSEAADRTQLFGFEEDEARLIDAALAGIERFSSVGIVDRFDESLALTYDVLDLPGGPEVVFDNRTPAKYIDQEITEEILDHARRLTRADEIVVESARARLDDWAASHSVDHDGD